MRNNFKIFIILLVGLSFPVNSSLAFEVKCNPGSTFVKCPKSQNSFDTRKVPEKKPSLRDSNSSRNCFKTSGSLKKCLDNGR